MRLKELQIKEDATAGATASGNIATVVNPHVANPSRKSVAYTGKPGVSGKGPVKQAKGGTYNTGKNALDMDVKLLSSKEPQMLRRQIKEGSLYNRAAGLVKTKDLYTFVKAGKDMMHVLEINDYGDRQIQEFFNELIKKRIF